MAADVVLALDQGSSSARAIAFDLEGAALARSQSPLNTLRPRGGWVEFEPGQLLRAANETAEAALRALPKSASVAAVGMACQRSTVVFWDAKTGKAAMNAPSWQDGRAAALVEPLAKKAEDIHRKTGLVLNPFYSLAKILWALENDAAVRRLRDQGRLRVGPVSSYLLWHWTKGEVFACDPTMAQRMLLLDLAKLQWDPGLVKTAGLAAESLPNLIPSAGLGLTVALAGRTLPFEACLGDQQAAAFGLGITEPGRTAANYGTGAFLLHHIGFKPKHAAGLLSSVACRNRAEAPRYFLEGTVNAAGTGLDWLRARLGVQADDKDLNALYARSSHRVLALLALGGLGAPRWDTKVLSGFFGLRQDAGPEDLVRGFLDSVAFLISDIGDAMGAAGASLGEVRVSGGLSWVDGLLQLQADLLQTDVVRLKEHERTSLGAAALAAGAAHATFKVPLDVDKAFRPRMKAEQAARLKSCWKTFVEAFQGLSRDPKVFESLLEWQEIFK